jgi:hypothetical protein
VFARLLGFAVASEIGQSNRRFRGSAHPTKPRCVRSPHKTGRPSCWRHWWLTPAASLLPLPRPRSRPTKQPRHARPVQGLSDQANWPLRPRRSMVVALSVRANAMRWAGRLWVKNRPEHLPLQCPLYPSPADSIRSPTRSAWCQHETFAIDYRDWRLLGSISATTDRWVAVRNVLGN